jgi:hypothetical protein
MLILLATGLQLELAAVASHGAGGQRCAAWGGRAARHGKASGAFIRDTRVGGRGEAERAGRGRPVRQRAGGQAQGRTAARVPGRGQAGSTYFCGPSTCVPPRDGAGCVGKARGGSGTEARQREGAGRRRRRGVGLPGFQLALLEIVLLQIFE